MGGRGGGGEDVATLQALRPLLEVQKCSLLHE